MRVLLFTGKGGVGKTTIAAATAVHAARCGVKTVVASADAAHSLADSLAQPLGPEPVEIEPGLTAVHIDARARGERSWGRIQEYLTGVLDVLGVDPVVADELTALPGAEEILALLEVRDLVTGSDHDLVIVDCAPTAETLRLLALPEALSRYLRLALPVERRVMRAMAAGALAAAGRAGGRGGAARGADRSTDRGGTDRGGTVRGGTVRGGTVRGGVRGDSRPSRDHVVEAAEQLHAELAGVREVLAGPNASVRLVLTPEALVIAEARRALTALAVYGYVVDGVVANRLVPAGGQDEWRSGWARSQAERLAAAEPSFAPLPVLRAAYAEAEPIGPEALAALGASLYGPVSTAQDAVQALLAGPDPASRVRVERDGAEFVLVVPMPDADRSQMSLDRVGDDLCLQVATHRRALALPSVLRRCIVIGARLADGALRVRFRPDPALWRAP